MTLELTDWDNDLSSEVDEEYQALVRTLNLTEGFGLFFVRCSPAESEELIARVKEDIPHKSVEVLRLKKPINNLYERIEQLDNKKKVNILFITGLEHSFYEYEEYKRLTGWNSRDIYSYSWKGVPPVLINLNQQRERFRDNFNICFVFLLPIFGIKYFIQRAPDFFDWRSGLFEFPKKPENLEIESSRILLEGDSEKDLTLSPEERTRKILEIQELIAEDHQVPSRKGDLLFTLGNLHFAAQNYEEAIAAYDEAVKIQPDYYQAWYNRGLALRSLERFSEAVTSFDQALKIQPDFDLAWNNRGAVLCENLRQYEEAIASYDQAVRIQPELHEARYNLGIALFKLKRFLEAITSLNKALEIKPDDHKTLLVLSIAQTQYDFNLYHELSSKLEDYKLESLFFGVVRYEKPTGFSMTLDEKLALAQYWRERIALEYQQVSEVNRESIVHWLIGSDSNRFEMLNPKELDIAKQAMEYRYRILLQRYLGLGRERGYRNLINRLASLVTLRNKIKTWVSLSRDRQRTVLDVLQEVLQELLQSDIYVQKQIIFVKKVTDDVRLQNSLLFAALEEYCLRPVRNQPLLVYRFVNYLHRTQRGGLTQVPASDSIKLISEEVLTDDSDNRVNLMDSDVVAEYQEAQEQSEQQALRQIVKQEFENYLLENLGQEAVQWLKLYLQGKSQDEIAKELNKPLKEVYPLREKISYHAVRVFGLKGQPELLENWLSISAKEYNFGLTQKQSGLLLEKLTAIQQQILELRKAGDTFDAIAQQLKLKSYQVISEWTKIYLLAQKLRNS